MTGLIDKSIDFIVEPSVLHSAALAVPGDKSISHRALLLGSVASGASTIRGFLDGEDCVATRRALEALGVRIDDVAPGTITVNGQGFGSLRSAADALDLGNSGTGMRLLAGLLAGQGVTATLTGDESLRSRPMGRVIEPLTAMGARIDSEDGRAPLVLGQSPRLHGISWRLPVASAQVKSAILLAGLMAEGVNEVMEPAPTRDHTERMLAEMGVAIRNESGKISMVPAEKLRALDLDVPGDLSSAAFLIVATLVSRDVELWIRGVGINPTRTGALTILKAMGADIHEANRRQFGNEPVADIRVRSSALHGIHVDPRLVPLAIDEFPALFAAAACAEGETTFSGIGELRVKESDRIEAMACGLRKLGIKVTATADGAVVTGGRLFGGEVDSLGDHRIAMAFAVLAAKIDSTLTIRNVANVATSFPGFVSVCSALGLRIRESANE
jgi:3-phosphoshikimate 1-carboxyvinyltransferase